MSQVFIIYKPYKDLSTTECLLMSWIISLNDAKQAICFSNQYASKMLKVSVPTITRSVAQLKSLGFINTFQPFGDKRFIHLIKKPELENISLEVCDLEGVEDLITHDNQNEYTPNQNDTYPSSQGLEPIITTITNNIEYKKDNNDTTLYDLRFNKIVELFPKSKHKGVDEAYNYTWLFLNDEDKKQIEKILPVYIQRNKQTPNYIKQISNYFNEKFWITDEISLSLLKENKTKPQKRFKL
jgi:hypothetical protein